MRPMISFVKEVWAETPLIGAEIGVYRGEHSEEILNNIKIEKLYAIDPWIEYKDGNLFKKKVSKERIEDAEKETYRRLMKFTNVQIIKGHSYSVVDRLPMLDFLYIDGAHDFWSVWRDIRCFSGKTLIMGGHDYNWKNIGVLLAVNIYRVLNIFKLELHTEDNDWWFVPRS
jgi:hypothetical protein